MKKKNRSTIEAPTLMTVSVFPNSILAQPSKKKYTDGRKRPISRPPKP
jgi:hypothetical protein